MPGSTEHEIDAGAFGAVATLVGELSCDQPCVDQALIELQEIIADYRKDIPPEVAKTRDPEAGRRITGRVGPFTGGKTRARIVDDAGNAYLRVEFFGDEQAVHGLTDEPALTFIVRPDGELMVNGPNPFGETFEAFKKLGWATEATGHEGSPLAGWSRLVDPASLHGRLPINQVQALLAASIRENPNYRRPNAVSALRCLVC